MHWCWHWFAHHEGTLYGLRMTISKWCSTNICSQAKDITDLGTLKEASKIFVPGDFCYLRIGCCTVFFWNKLDDNEYEAFTYFIYQWWKLINVGPSFLWFVHSKWDSSSYDQPDTY